MELLKNIQRWIVTISLLVIGSGLMGCNSSVNKEEFTIKVKSNLPQNSLVILSKISDTHAILIPTLLFAKLDNVYVLLMIFSTILELMELTK